MSSTFGDLKAERNALQSSVFPEFKTMCEAEGYQFQLIDLRWGISEEATLNQQTMRICLEEVAHCQTISSFPNFMILLGDRYGWNPLPYQIPRTSFEKLVQEIESQESKIQDLNLLKNWYLLDENAIVQKRESEGQQNGVYYLKPRHGEEANWQNWNRIENKLREILRTAARKVLPREELGPFFLSATAQEIVRGAFNISPEARNHVFCFARKITNIEKMYEPDKDLPADSSKTLPPDYIDVADGRADLHSHQLQTKLRDRLKSLLPDSFIEYESEWNGTDISYSHLDPLCADVSHALKTLIGKRKTADSLSQPSVPALAHEPRADDELMQHFQFARERQAHFTGRENLLGTVRETVRKSLDDLKQGNFICIIGDGGSGKTSFSAKLFPEIQNNFPGAVVIPWFVGISPRSASLRDTLSAFARCIHESFNSDRPFSQDRPAKTSPSGRFAGTPPSLDGSLPTALPALIREMKSFFALGSSQKPVIMVLDAIDQMGENDLEYVKTILSESLPPHVIFIFSLLDGSHLFSQLESRFTAIPSFRMDRLNVDDAQAVLRDWFSDFSRTLQPAQETALLEAFSENGRPLYLKLMFERAKSWKSGEQASIPGDGIDDLIRQLFDDLARPENHGPLLVKQALSFLACSRHGLAEEELTEILAWDEEFWLEFLIQTYHDIPTSFSQNDFVDFGGFLKKNNQRKNPLSLKLQEYLAGIPSTDPIAGANAVNQAIRNETFCRPEILREIQVTPAIYLRLEKLPKEKKLPVFNRWILEKMFPQEIKKGKRRVPTVLWTRLASDLSPYFSLQFLEGHLLITFIHRQFPENIFRLYLEGDNRRKIHSILSDYFFSQPNRIRQGPQKGAEGAKIKEDDRREASTSTLEAFPNVRKLNELVFHAIRGERWDLVSKTLLSLSFLEAKVESGFAFDLLNDFGETVKCLPSRDGGVPANRPDGDVLAGLPVLAARRRLYPLLLQGLKFTFPFLLRHPKTVFQCLWNQCWWHDHPSALNHFQNPEGSPKHSTGVPPVEGSAHLDSPPGEGFSKHSPGAPPVEGKPVSASEEISIGSPKIENPPSANLHAQMEAWRKARKTRADSDPHDGGSGPPAPGWRTPGGPPPWLRALRPPAAKLDSALVASFPAKNVAFTCLTLTSDGKKAAAGTAQGTIVIWETHSAREILSWKTDSSGIKSLGFSPDGEVLVGCCGDHSIRWWRPGTGAETNRIECWNASHVRFSPNGDWFVTSFGEIGFGGMKPEIRVWETDTGRALSVCHGHEDRITDIAISPSGDSIASASADKTVRIWNRKTGEEVHRFSLSVFAACLAFVNDPNRLLCGGSDKVIRLWDLADSREIRTFHGHQAGITALAVSPDGEILASGSGGGKVASRDNSIKLWHIDSGAEINAIHGHRHRVSGLAFLPNGTQIISTSWDKTARLWDSRFPESPLSLIDHEKEITCIATSPVSPLIITGSSDTTMKLWHARTGACLQSFGGHELGVLQALFSPGGDLILTCGGDETIKLWSIKGGPHLFSITPGGLISCPMAFSPDGRFFAGAVTRPETIVWETETGKEVSRFSGFQGFVSSMKFSPIGESLILGDSGGRLTHWHFFSGQKGREISAHPDGINAIDISPDSRLLLTGSKDRAVKLWDLETWNLRKVFEGNHGGIRDVAFSKDGREFFSDSEDFFTHLWDIEAGKMLKKIPGKGGVREFAADRQFILVSMPENETALVDRHGEIQTWYQGGRFSSSFDGSFWAITEGNHLQILTCLDEK